MVGNIKELYRIVSGTSEEKAHVQGAIDFLFSQKAWNIGKGLLNKAYKRHKKPVIIHAARGEAIGYDHVEHAIYINPEQVSKLNFLDYKGVRYEPTLESTLAHEFVHAGQDAIAIEKLKNSANSDGKLKILDRIYIDKVSAYESDIANARTYESAMEKLNEFADWKLPSKMKSVEYQYNHPTFREYIKKVEDPAVNAERLVSSAQRSGIRKEYIDPRILAPEYNRKKIIDKYVESLDIDKKPRKRKAPSGAWSSRVVTAKDQSQENVPKFS